MKKMLIIGMLLILLAGCANQPPAVEEPTDDPNVTVVTVPTSVPRPEGRFEGMVTNDDGLTFPVAVNYIVDLPPGYEELDGPLPMQIFLHGAGFGGNNINSIRGFDRFDVLETNYQDYPLIILFPQLPAGTSWGAISDLMPQLIDDLEGQYPIDTDRIYLTGHGAGGFGVLEVAQDYPEEFAALASVAGFFNNEASTLCEPLEGIPLWLLHGEQDETVSPRTSQALYDALQECDTELRMELTLFEDADHSSIMNEVFGNLDFYEWMLDQSL